MELGSDVGGRDRCWNQTVRMLVVLATEVLAHYNPRIWRVGDCVVLRGVGPEERGSGPGT
jgi:hypothetical protein